MKILIALFLMLFGLQAKAYLEFSPVVLHRIEQIVSVYENRSIEQAYDYIEDIKDGRGYTAGKIGFTSATYDMALVIRKYLSHKPEKQNDWNPLLKVIDERSENYDGSTKGLEKLPKLWKNSCSDADFIKSQDEIAYEMYMQPAMNELESLGLKSNFALLVIYDTLVQHGEGEDANEDPDSYKAILSKVMTNPKNETGFLQEFLEVRRAVLENPSDEETQEAWAESVDRIDSLEDLLYSPNRSLNHPIDLQMDDEVFHIK